MSYYERHKKHALEVAREYYRKNKETINLKKREKRLTSVLRRKPRRSTPLPKVLENAKLIVLKHYGKKCFCCYENKVKLLTVEHTNGDGYLTRRQGIKGKWLYSFLIHEGFPSFIQILCFNCNIGKKNNGGICPHKS